MDSGAAFSGGANADTFNATHLTLSASDVLVGGLGADVLNVVDTGTAAFTLPSAQVSGIETINLRNINGTAATAAVKNVTQTTFGTTVTSATAGTIITFANVATADVVITPAVSSTHTGQTLAIAAAAAINAATGSLYVATVVDNTLTLTARTAGAVTAVTAVLTLSATSTGVISQVATTAGAALVAAAGATDTITATNFIGATAFNADNSTSAVKIDGLAASQSAGIIGNGSDTNGASTFGWGAAVTAGTINVSGGTTGTGIVTTSGTLLATNTINSTGASNTIGALTLGAAVTTLNINATSALTTGAVTNTTAAALTRINVTGSAAVSLSATAQQSTVAVIDASAATAALTVALGSNVAQVVTGGSGNDVITTGAVLTTGSVDAGAGTGDVLVVGTNVSHVNTAVLAAKYTNFEILRIGAATFDMGLFGGMTSVQLTGAAVLSNMTATQAASVSARSNIGNADLGLLNSAGTSDVLTITNGLGTTNAVATTIGTLTATGFETINLRANAGPSAVTGDSTSTLTAITDTSLTAVNLTGTAWTLGDIASTKAVTWTATALTGNRAAIPVGLTLTTTGAAAAGSIVNASEVRDSIIMDSSTGVTFNLGGGNDIFSTTSTLLLPSGAATDNTINAGAGASDRLVITLAATLTDTSFTKTSGFEELELAGSTTANSVTGLGAGFLGGFANGVSVTDTAAQTGANAYTWASGLYSKNVTIVHETTYAGTAAGGNQTITTGGGNDNITVIASSWVGAAAATGATIAVSAGAGNDIITVTTGTQLAQTTTAPVVITGGLGADTIFSTGVNITTGAGVLTTTYVVAAGDSLVTAYDSITGFDLGTAGLLPSTLNLEGTGAVTAYAATAVAGYTAAQLTVAVTTTSGLVVFAGTSAAALTLADKIAAVQSVVVTNNNDLAVFTHGGNTYVFENNTTADTLVELVGVTGTNIITANANTAGSILVI